MTLGELIDFLEPQNPVLVLPEGFATPHSYRGYYDELAFEPAQNVTVGAMLDSARSAVGATYGGWKGGDFTMDLYTTVHLAVEGCTGEGIGPVVLRLMLAAGREAAVTAATPAQPASVSPHLECAVCASGVTTPHGAAGTPGQAAFAEYYSRQAGAAVSMPDSWNMQSDATRADWEAAATAVETGQLRLARQDRDQLRKHVLDLAADLDISAAATRPSKKSTIEDELAIALRKVAEPPS